MKRKRESYSKKRKYEFINEPNKKHQLIYDHNVIDKQNTRYHAFLYF